jgi:hypothetical protein
VTLFLCLPIGSYRYTAHLLELDGYRPLVARLVPAIIAGVNSPLSRSLQSWRERLHLHSDQEFVGYILGGLEASFRVGFHYKNELSPSRRNMPSALEHPEVVEHYLGGRASRGQDSRAPLKEGRPGTADQPVRCDPEGADHWEMEADYGPLISGGT